MFVNYKFLAEIVGSHAGRSLNCARKRRFIRLFNRRALDGAYVCGMVRENVENIYDCTGHANFTNRHRYVLLGRAVRLVHQ